MTELIDVSKWFGTPVRINPDFVISVHLEGKRFIVFDIASSENFKWQSKEFNDTKIAEVEMEQFCKKIQGEI